MKRIEVFPEIEEARGKPIDGEKLEEFLKSAKTDWIFKKMVGNVSPYDKFLTLCMVCQELFNELEELKEKMKGVEPT